MVWVFASGWNGGADSKGKFIQRSVSFATAGMVLLAIDLKPHRFFKTCEVLIEIFVKKFLIYE